MKFNYRQVRVSKSQAFPKREFLLRPIIPISLSINDKRLRYEALIDSGADYTIFSSDLGRKLGINIEKGKKDIVEGVSGETLEIYFHDIFLEVSGLRFKVYVGFANDVSPSSGILGQFGFFDKFTVKFNLKKEEIEIKEK